VQPFAYDIGCLCYSGGNGSNHGLRGDNGNVSGKQCPRGLYGIYCVVRHVMSIFLLSYLGLSSFCGHLCELNIQETNKFLLTLSYYKAFQSLTSIVWMLHFLKQECPLGTYKNETGSSEELCRQCPLLPSRAEHIYVRGEWKLLLTSSWLYFKHCLRRCKINDEVIICLPYF
jgi:hypothetical protein